MPLKLRNHRLKIRLRKRADFALGCVLFAVALPVLMTHCPDCKTDEDYEEQFWGLRL